MRLDESEWKNRGRRKLDGDEWGNCERMRLDENGIGKLREDEFG
jgi:hypothetical protein